MQQRGFTLIEVMVALMIVAIALPALMFQLGTQLDHSAVLSQRTQAAWVAQDQLALLQLRQAAGETLPPGEWRGEVQMAGQHWFWRRSAEPTPVPELLRHTIRVAHREQDVASTESSLFTLDGYFSTTSLSAISLSTGAEP